MNCHFQFSTLCFKQRFKTLRNLADQYRTAVFRAPDEVVFEAEYSPSVFSVSAKHQIQYTIVSNQNQEERHAIPLPPKVGSPLA
jgi:hypothetical protein